MSSSHRSRQRINDDAEDVSLSAPNRFVDVGNDKPILLGGDEDEKRDVDNVNQIKADEQRVNEVRRTGGYPQLVSESEADVSFSQTEKNFKRPKTGKRPGTRSSAAPTNTINRPDAAIPIEDSRQVEAQGNEPSVMPTSGLPYHLSSNMPLVEAELVVPSGDVEGQRPSQNQLPQAQDIVNLLVQQLRQNPTEAEVTTGQDDAKTKEQKPAKIKRRIFILSTLAVIAVVVSILLWKFLPRQSPASPVAATGAPSSSPQSEFSSLSRTEAFVSLMVANNISEEALLDKTTPQYQAMNWLAEDDQLKLEVNSTAQIIMERFVLALLYFATDGPNWPNQNRFLTGVSVCLWQGQGGSLSGSGVNCNTNDRAEKLLLERNQLAGVIPSEIGILSNLQVLRFAENKLTGTIPTEMGLLFELQFITLSNNTLAGSIPDEFWSLPNMQQLYTWENQLTGSIPTEIGRLRQALAIDVSENILTGSIPSEIGMLLNLTTLNFWKNSLSKTIPTEIGWLKQLERLNLKQGSLTGSIPSGIWGLTKLTSLSLGYNDLTGTLSSQIGALTNLETLDLWEGRLSGTIPTEIGNLKQLTIFVLLSNDFRGSIPTEVGQLQLLDVFGVANNSLTGTLPSEVGQLSRLSFIAAYKNALNGTVPTELASLPLLDNFFLGFNDFVGDFSSSICNQSVHQRQYENLQADCGEVLCPCCTSCCRGQTCSDHTPQYVNRG